MIQSFNRTGKTSPNSVFTVRSAHPNPPLGLGLRIPAYRYTQFKKYFLEGTSDRLLKVNEFNFK